MRLRDSVSIASSLVLLISSIMMSMGALNQCAPPAETPVSTPAAYKGQYISRYIDREAGVVCWVLREYDLYGGLAWGGISCLPLSTTKLDE